MASRASGSTLTGDTFTVRVLHGIADSFSRSVDQCAKREVRRINPWPSARVIGLTDARYAVPDETGPRGECVSYIVFTRQ